MDGLGWTRRSKHRTFSPYSRCVERFRHALKPANLNLRHPKHSLLTGAKPHTAHTSLPGVLGTRRARQDAFDGGHGRRHSAYPPRTRSGRHHRPARYPTIHGGTPARSIAATRGRRAYASLTTPPLAHHFVSTRDLLPLPAPYWRALPPQRRLMLFVAFGLTLFTSILLRV